MRKVHVYDDWSGGDIGRGFPANAPTNKYRGVNCWKYPNNTIGPRPPWQDLRMIGADNQGVTYAGFFRSPTTGLARIIWARAGATYTLPAGFDQTPSATAPAGPTNAPRDGVMVAGVVYFCSTAGTGFTIDLSTNVLTNVAAIPSGEQIDSYGNQYIISDHSASTIYFSALNDPNTWTGGTAGTIVVGDTSSRFLWTLVQRNTIVVLKDNGEVWQVTGVLGYNESVRKVDQTGATVSHSLAHAAVTSQSGAWWWGFMDMFKFDGTGVKSFHLPDVPAFGGYSVPYYRSTPGHVVPLLEDDSFALIGMTGRGYDAGDQRAYMLTHRPGIDNWTRHHMPIFASNPSASPAELSAREIQTDTLEIDGVIMAVSEGGPTPASATGVYVLNTQQEVPHLPIGTLTSQNIQSQTLFDGSVTSPVTAEITLPEFWAEDGSQVFVRSVTVDYSYDPRIPLPEIFNKFSVSVESFLPEDGQGFTPSAIQSFLPTGLETPLEGTFLVRGQKTFNFGEQGVTGAYRVKFSDWVGVSIHRVSVTCDLSESRH